MVELGITQTTGVRELPRVAVGEWHARSGGEELGMDCG